ncbi:MAG: thymidine phosphorylase [Armatimonadetes bacterium]|nr:thymidine phosphorylase [Armatimonadota bacterium]
MRTLDLIAKKRDGGEHTDDELRLLVNGCTRGDIPDYQMSAWLMAVVWRGLSEHETFALTAAMAASGDTLDLSSIPGTPVDKHSTGGVGDKTSLAVVPILASAGVPVAKMSGRGLGHTGGTLDKLESIPGTRVHLTVEEILHQVRTVGACVCAQTDNLVPADRKLYALRDATATVESRPLIAASVMSKKLACGAPVIVLDVKVGGGAFMKTLEQARALAGLMIGIGQAQGRRVAAVLSDMNAPLGRAVGNRLEVLEVVRLLYEPSQADPRLLSLVRHLSAVAFTLSGKTATLNEGAALAERQLDSGAAHEKWCQIIEAQGGDARAGLKTGPVQWPVQATRDGDLSGIHAEAIGVGAMRLGAGRATKEDQIDPAAGIILEKTVGDRIRAGETLATLYCREEALAREVAPAVRDAFRVSEQPLEATPLIYDTLGLEP